MADANVYTQFKNIIASEDGTVDISDPLIFQFLNGAIRKMSTLHEYIYTQTKTITASDVTNGYFTLEKRPVEILEGLSESNLGDTWQYGRDKKILIIDDSFPTGTINFKYRAFYTEFDLTAENGELDVDWLEEDDEAVYYYALGMYAQKKSSVNADGVSGVIKRIKEENMEREYGGGSESSNNSSKNLSTPRDLMDYAIELMRASRRAQKGLYESI